jgi:hypothetical protein
MSEVCARLQVDRKKEQVNNYPLDIRRYPEVIEITLKTGGQFFVPAGTWLNSSRKMGYDLGDIQKARRV